MKLTTYSTTSMNKTQVRVITIVLAAMILICAWHVGGALVWARAEEESTTTAWALCKPGTYVNIRLWPSKKAAEVGYLDPCDKVEVDGRVKDGFAHIVEPLDGWVYAGYLTFSEPKAVNANYIVVARKRVATRRWIDGPQMGTRPWLINGSELTVYYISEDWAITSRGFVRSEWLEEDP